MTYWEKDPRKVKPGYKPMAINVYIKRVISQEDWAFDHGSWTLAEDTKWGRQRTMTKKDRDYYIIMAICDRAHSLNHWVGGMP